MTLAAGWLVVACYWWQGWHFSHFLYSYAAATAAAASGAFAWLRLRYVPAAVFLMMTNELNPAPIDRYSSSSTPAVVSNITLTTIKWWCPPPSSIHQVTYGPLLSPGFACSALLLPYWMTSNSRTPGNRVPFYQFSGALLDHRHQSDNCWIHLKGAFTDPSENSFIQFLRVDLPLIEHCDVWSRSTTIMSTSMDTTTIR